MDAYALRLDHTVTDQTALCNYSFFRKKTSICNKEKLCKDLYIKDLGGGGEKGCYVLCNILLSLLQVRELNTELFIYMLDIFPMYIYTEIRKFGLRTTFLSECWTISGF